MTTRVWVTRDKVTTRHLRGLLQALEADGALDYDTVQIMTLRDGQPEAVVLDDQFRVNGQRLPAGSIMWETLPPEGLLAVPDESLDDDPDEV